MKKHKPIKAEGVIMHILLYNNGVVCFRTDDGEPDVKYKISNWSRFSKAKKLIVANELKRRWREITGREEEAITLGQS